MAPTMRCAQILLLACFPCLLQSNEPHRIVPISGLNPYLARWTIKARVTQKGDVRRWASRC